MHKPGGHWESTLVGGHDGVRGGSIPFVSNGGANPPFPAAELCVGTHQSLLGWKPGSIPWELSLNLRNVKYFCYCRYTLWPQKKS
jgi:hypothetical protein